MRTFWARAFENLETSLVGPATRASPGGANGDVFQHMLQICAEISAVLGKMPPLELGVGLGGRRRAWRAASTVGTGPKCITAGASKPREEPPPTGEDFEDFPRSANYSNVEGNSI